jgi:hypothetical protein
MYVYLTGSFIFLIIWLVLYTLRRDLRKDMLFGSLLSMPLAITEFIFVPGYWNPQVVLKIPFLTSFIDLESFIFSFAVGGIAAILYEFVLKKRLVRARENREITKRHFYALSLCLIVSFILFFAILRVPLIYSGIISLFAGSLVVAFNRKDLFKEMIIGGCLFLVVYFIIFICILNFIYPNWIITEWNLNNLLGVFIFGIPIEELLYALSFGSLWVVVYEDIKGYRSR